MSLLPQAIGAINMTVSFTPRFGSFGFEPSQPLSPRAATALRLMDENPGTRLKRSLETMVSEMGDDANMSPYKGYIKNYREKLAALERAWTNVVSAATRFLEAVPSTIGKPL